MIYLLIGRFGAGKHHLAEKMKEAITPNKTDNNAVLSCIGRDQIMQNNILIINPNQLQTVADADKTEAFCIVHVEADDLDRRLNYVQHAEKKLKAEELLEQIDTKENNEYLDFEDNMHTLIHNNTIDWLPDNIAQCYHHVNDYTEDVCHTFVMETAMWFHLLSKTTDIVTALNEKQLLQDNSDAPDGLLAIRQIDGTSKFVTPSYFTALLLSDNGAFAEIMKKWLLSDNLEPTS